MTTAAEILDRIESRPLVPLDLPEWGQGYFVRTLSMEEFQQLQAAVDLDAEGQPDDRDWIARTILACIVTADRKQMFAEEHREKIKRIRDDVLIRIYHQCAAVNNIAMPGAPTDGQ